MKKTTSPLYATAVGLVMNAAEVQSKVTRDKEVIEEIPQNIDPIVSEAISDKEIVDEQIIEKPREEKKSFFQKWSDNFRVFLDTAE